MTDATTIRLLHRAAAILRDSLPRYLMLCPPANLRGEGAARAALRSAADDNELHLSVIGKLLEDHGGNVSPSTFPLAYTSLNDLGMDYLVERLAVGAEHDYVALDTIARQLPYGTLEQARVEEAAGAVQAHADSWRLVTSRRLLR